MLIYEIVITLRVQNQNIHRIPLMPSEAALTEFAHDCFKDAVSATVKLYKWYLNNTEKQLTEKKVWLRNTTFSIQSSSV
jgi:hypothetical protein